MGLDKLPEIVTVKQLCEFLQVSDQTVIRAIKSGELRAFKVGREWRVEKDAVMKWVKNRNDPSPTKTQIVSKPTPWRCK
jgi:excisionase family DNA binding protein